MSKSAKINISTDLERFVVEFERFVVEIVRARLAFISLEKSLKKLNLKGKPLFYSKHSKRTVYAKSRHI